MTTLDAFAFAGRWDAAALPPAAPGGSFRSLLLWPSDGDGWILGRWDGENWCDDQGLIIPPPKAWAALPPRPHAGGARNQVAAPVPGDSIAELHRRWLALAEEYDQVRGKRDECRRATWPAGMPPAVIGSNGVLTSDDMIDAEIAAALEAIGGDSRRRRPYLVDQLERRRAWLKGELAAACAANGGRLEECGLAALDCRLDQLVADMESIGAAIRVAPLRSIADLAALLDLVLECDLAFLAARELDVAACSPGLPAALREKLPWLAFLFRAVRDAVPDFEFSLIGRSGLRCGSTGGFYRSRRRPGDYDKAIATIGDPWTDDHGVAAGEAPAELRRRAEALAAEYDLPLPPGDAGLIEAERRYAELIRRSGALSREFDLGPEGDQIFEATVYPVENDLWELIGDAVPEGLAGIAVKLRMVRELQYDQDAGPGAALGQCIDALSQLAGRPA